MKCIKLYFKTAKILLLMILGALLCSNQVSAQEISSKTSNLSTEINIQDEYTQEFFKAYEQVHFGETIFPYILVVSGVILIIGFIYYIYYWYGRASKLYVIGRFIVILLLINGILFYLLIFQYQQRVDSGISVIYNQDLSVSASEQNERRYVSAIELTIPSENNTYLVCNGARIHKHIILTTAHCVNSKDIQQTKIKLFYYNKAAKPVEMQVDASIRIHPDWNLINTDMFNSSNVALVFVPNYDDSQTVASIVNNINVGCEYSSIDYSSDSEESWLKVKKSKSLCIGEMAENSIDSESNIDATHCKDNMGGPVYKSGTDEIIGMLPYFEDAGFKCNATNDYINILNQIDTFLNLLNYESEIDFFSNVAVLNEPIPYQIQVGDYTQATSYSWVIIEEDWSQSTYCNSTFVDKTAFLIPNDCIDTAVENMIWIAQKYKDGNVINYNDNPALSNFEVKLIAGTTTSLVTFLDSDTYPDNTTTRITTPYLGCNFIVIGYLRDFTRDSKQENNATGNPLVRYSNQICISEVNDSTFTFVTNDNSTICTDYYIGAAIYDTEYKTLIGLIDAEMSKFSYDENMWPEQIMLDCENEYKAYRMDFSPELFDYIQEINLTNRIEDLQMESCGPLDTSLPKDGKITFEDFVDFTPKYNTVCKYEVVEDACGSADFDGNGTIDLADFLHMVELFDRGNC